MRELLARLGMKAGNGDLIKGFEHYNQMPYAEPP